MWFNFSFESITANVAHEGFVNWKYELSKNQTEMIDKRQEKEANTQNTCYTHNSYGNFFISQREKNCSQLLASHLVVCNFFRALKDVHRLFSSILCRFGRLVCKRYSRSFNDSVENVTRRCQDSKIISRGNKNLFIPSNLMSWNRWRNMLKHLYRFEIEFKFESDVSSYFLQGITKTWMEYYLLHSE